MEREKTLYESMCATLESNREYLNEVTREKNRAVHRAELAEKKLNAAITALKDQSKYEKACDMIVSMGILSGYGMVQILKMVEE